MEREPWSLEAFVRAYDALAGERGGWRWGGEIEEGKLKGWYETGACRTVAEFAEGRYALDQEV